MTISSHSRFGIPDATSYESGNTTLEAEQRVAEAGQHKDLSQPINVVTDEAAQISTSAAGRASFSFRGPRQFQ